MKLSKIINNFIFKNQVRDGGVDFGSATSQAPGYNLCIRLNRFMHISSDKSNDLDSQGGALTNHQ